MVYAPAEVTLFLSADISRNRLGASLARFGPKRYEVFAFCIDYLLPGAVSIALDFLYIHSDLKDVTLILLKIVCDCVQ